MKDNVRKMLNLMTLEEKASLASGVGSWNTTPIERVGLPSARLSDGPHGVRKELEQQKARDFFRDAYPSTCFPPAVTLASSWDRELVGKVGNAIGEECLELEVDTILGPGINIKRNPVCGRNFEYFSEDPYLAGELASAYIGGVQSTGVGVSLKHFCANNKEHKRMVSDSIIDERTLREIYLAAFEKAVKKSHPRTVMCSYNLLNNVRVSENKWLLKDVLRRDWGYEGLVMSDWGAVSDRIKGVTAGLNLEMPSSGGSRDKEIIEAVKSGRLSERDLDECVAPVIELAMNAAQNRAEHKGYKADFKAHHELARRAAEEGAVLLKNEGGLPIKEGAKIAVVGEMAERQRTQGSGSSRLHPIKEVSFIEHLRSIGASFDYAKGYDSHNETPIEELEREAINIANGKDVVLAFVGLTDDFESEGFDREHIEIPSSHNRLIEKLCDNGANVVAVVTGGSAIKMTWLSKVSAVLYLGLTGEAGGEAVYNLVTGKVNPSGKLAETFPMELEDVPSTATFDKDEVLYKESVYVGYRYFETAKVPVLFPFGYGLSYTKFDYSNIKLSRSDIADGDTLVVSFDVTNVGKVAGAEVAELYVKDNVSTIFRPDRELKGFEKVFLNPGETKRVSISLSKRDFAFYNVLQGDFSVESGLFTIMVGGSCRDIRLTGTVNYNSFDELFPNYRTDAECYYDMSLGFRVTEGEFETIYGKELPEFKAGEKGEYTMDTVVDDLNGRGFPRIFKFFVAKGSSLLLPKNADSVTKKMVLRGGLDMPLRNLYAMSNGILTKKSAEGLLMMLNGKFLKGLGRFIGGFINKPKLKEKIYKV